MDYSFKVEHQLSDDDLLLCFHYMKNYLINLYGHSATNDENFNTWKTNRTGSDKNKFFIKIFKKDELIGFAELMIKQNNTLYFCDIIIKDEKRFTRAVFEFVKFVLSMQEFKIYNEIYLHINKRNIMSLNTWSHFGLIKLEEGKNSNYYKINRKSIENYINKFTK